MLTLKQAESIASQIRQAADKTGIPSEMVDRCWMTTIFLDTTYWQLDTSTHTYRFTFALDMPPLPPGEENIAKLIRISYYRDGEEGWSSDVLKEDGSLPR